MLVRLAMFTVVIAAATLFDMYLEDNPVELDKVSTESEDSCNEYGSIYLINPSGSFNAKTASQKLPVRKVKLQSHDKFIQKYHQLRNNQVLKAEVQTQTAPLIQSYHYLVFKNYFFSFPDDDPLIS